MYTIRTNNIGTAHDKVVELIMRSTDYNDIKTEDKEFTIEYPEPVNIHIVHPDHPPFASQSFKFGIQALDAYKEQILTPRKLVDRTGLPDFSYLYSNLIFDFPSGDYTKLAPRVDWCIGNGRGNGKNQIEYVIKKLDENPTSRRAVVTLFEPHGHTLMDDPPCLNHIQFMIRNGDLNCHALFRSNDMLSAWGGNAYALMYLQKHVMNEINKKKNNEDERISMGYLETTSISAHIYFKRDSHELNEFKRYWK